MKKNQSQVQGKETTLGERPIRIYIYEALNRLIHATGKAKNASYDMAMTFGRMSEPLTKIQKVDSTNTAKSYNFAYKYEDSNHPTAPTQIGHDHYTYDANGNPTLVTNDSTKEETFFYHSDHLGSTSYITDDKGNITQYDAYLPYGELLVDEHSSSEDLPYKFNGKQFDEETGLYYYGARYMNPVTSLWYGVDPLAEKYKSIGAYVYCSANPIRLIDSDGKKNYL